MSGQGYLDKTALHAQAKWRSALLTYPGNLKEALREAQKDAKKTMYGIAQGIPSPFLTKVYASVRPDFVWIDVEHGMFDRIVLHEYEHSSL
jgi:4-hydroxy-2-oxoheptanedioate aldolase